MSFRFENGRLRKAFRWVYRNRGAVFFWFSLSIHVAAILFVRFEASHAAGSEGSVYDHIAFTSVQIDATRAAAEADSAEGEIQASDEALREIDERIAAAVNPFRVGAIRPVDLTPGIKPDYTVEARKAGVEGTLHMEVVIADTGKVLLARPRNRLGYGLEPLAVAVFRKKKYRPALMAGRAITVRVIIPVRYALN